MRHTPARGRVPIENLLLIIAVIAMWESVSLLVKKRATVQQKTVIP